MRRTQEKTFVKWKKTNDIRHSWEKPLIEKRRDLKEYIHGMDRFHTFNVGEIAQLCFLCKDTQYNGRHVIVEGYDEDKHYWIVHLCEDLLKTKKRVKPQNIWPTTDDRFSFEDFCCDPRWNLIDETDEQNCSNIGNDHIYRRDIIPGTNAASFAYNILPRTHDSEMSSIFTSHVLFNLAGLCLTRYKRRIDDTQAQQSFIQRLASTITGSSVTLLYMMGVCFPCHFYLQSSRQFSAILGCPPISCYCGDLNPHSFVSTLQTTQNFVTNAWSSTCNCPLFLSFCYDIQTNMAGSGIDSQVIG